MKSIVILGITGSIGLSAVDVVRNHKDEFKIEIASAHRNFSKLFDLAKEFGIKNLVLTDEICKSNIKDIPDGVNLYFGYEDLLKLLNDSDYDIVLNSIAGSAGLRASIKTIDRGKDLALANKESLVMAGHIVNKKLETSSSRLLPVDSEHSALFQMIHDKPFESIRKLYLTASGGPFRSLDLNEFQNITIKDTLKHPTWSMGSKITVDSATMMNKGLEVIEAHWLYHQPYNKIDAVIHPQSIIHSMVEFVDGSILSQMSNPSMKLPILYAFTHPERLESDVVETDIFKLQDLTFQEITKDRYPLFYLAMDAGEASGIFPTLMNASNEAAVQLFLEEKIHFTEIYKLVDSFMQKQNNIVNPDLETIIRLNEETYDIVYRGFKDFLQLKG